MSSSSERQGAPAQRAAGGGADAGAGPLIEARRLVHRYPQGGGAVEALRGVDLKIERGEFTALMGPSGSGKSTLLNLIGALDLPSEGALRLEGRSLLDCSRRERALIRRDRIAFIFQSYNLLPILSAAENAELVLLARGLPAAERRARVLETLAAVGLEGLEERRPGQLSGGQQQRVAVARALACQPALILADEPTANLDSQTGAELIALMSRLNQERGVTFLFATHDPQVMAAARRVVRLVDGQIIEDIRRDPPGQGDMPARVEQSP